MSTRIAKDKQQITAVISKTDVERIDRVQQLQDRNSRSSTIGYLIRLGLSAVEEELGVVQEKEAV